MSDKQPQYSLLVEKRKQCHVCQSQGLNVVRLADCRKDEFGSCEIGPWTEWQGNLDAELMIVGQEWGGSKNYKNQEGCDRDCDDTNANLVELLRSIGRRIELPSKYQKKETKPEQPLYFTNAVLCLRCGKATAGEDKDEAGQAPAMQCFQNCASRFLKPQIELVQPKVIVSLGYKAYRAVLFSCGYDLSSEKTMRAALEKGKVALGNAQLLPMYHCGAGSTNRNRNLECQKLDWQSLRKALEE